MFKFLKKDHLIFQTFDKIQEERRRQMAQAAEKRLKQEEGRGMKDPEGFKRKLEQREKAEQQAKDRGNDNDAPLKVSLFSDLVILYFKFNNL